MTRLLASHERPTFQELDNIELRTVGIDIGSSTSHLTFSDIHLQRLGDRLSSRYVPVGRRIVFESEIVLTPYLGDYTIDADELGEFVARAYDAAGMRPADIDSGAVILTGEAAKRLNAGAISERLAEVAGEFVCATAGHRLEAIIAAHGSGAVAASREHSGRVLNVDIGGGTTKLALIEDGIIRSAAAISIGGRLVAWQDGVAARVEEAGEFFGERAGVDVRLGRKLEPLDVRRLARAMSDVVLDVIRGRPIDPALWLTPPLSPGDAPDLLSFSGGVGEYVHGRESRSYGDLGRELGVQIRDGLDAARLASSVLRPHAPIRATVIGASQYTVQVSGDTVSVSEDALLPMRNIKVVPGPPIPDGDLDVSDLAARLLRQTEASDVQPHEPVALAFSWTGRPYYARLAALARVIVAGAHTDTSRPLVIVFDSDVARSVGRIISNELGWTGALICLDGITVGEFDFVDIGRRLEPSGTHPVVVKSLVFPSAPSHVPERGA